MKYKDPMNTLSDYLRTIDLSPLDVVILNELKMGLAGVSLPLLVKRFEKDFQDESFLRELYPDVELPEKVGAARIKESILRLVEKGFLIEFTPENLQFLNFLFSSDQLKPFRPEVSVGRIGISWLGFAAVRQIRKLLKPKCSFPDCETRVLSDENHLCYFSSDPQLIRDELEYFDLKEEPVIEECGPWVCSGWWDIRPSGFRCIIPIPEELKSNLPGMS